MVQDLTVVIGYGAAGRAIATRLCAAGRRVRVAQRHRPDALPAGASFVATDVLDETALHRAADGASHIIFTTGFAYSTPVWRASWPVAMGNLIAAAEATGARTVFFDNCYMYGPQTGPISETAPYAPWGGKPAVRRAISEMWQAASAEGRIRFLAVRVPDFYGPGVSNSHLGPQVFARLAAGRSAQLVVPADMPHDFAYVPDVARAVETLLDAPEDAYGQVWHMPCAPTRTIRQLIELGAAALNRPARIFSVPQWVQPALGLAIPMVRELRDVRFLFDRPYHLDAGKFRRRFWSDVTPFEIGLPATARSYAAATTA